MCTEGFFLNNRRFRCKTIVKQEFKMRFGKSLLHVMLLSVLFFSVSAYAGMGKDLRKAAKDGHFKTVQRLLDKGADANATGGGGGTPLIKAAKGGHMDIVQLLLFHGGDPHQKNRSGNSALFIADRNDSHEIVSVMKEGLDEQAIPVSAQAMRSDEFVALMRKVFQNREYRVEHTGPHSVTAVYETSERLYKVTASMQGNRIMLQFLKGYGAAKINFLKNLKTDLVKTL